MKREPKFKFASEAAMCAMFIEQIDKQTWTPYAETAGWDILLVRKADGFQVGIQAKLRMGVDVINQAIDEYGAWSVDKPGPDCRAVLVPEYQGPFTQVCAYLAIIIITVKPPFPRGVSGMRIYPMLPQGPRAAFSNDWPEWCPSRRHKLPDYVPDVEAGASAPIQLTDWKIKALKLAVLLETRGFVMRSDFKYLSLDPRRWIEGRWLAHSEKGMVAGKNYPPFQKQHPRVYAEIKADAVKWMPKQDRLELSL